ncbi:MAG: hypothetical protein ABR599_07130 [Gemmatimonadota bacterium]
MSKRLEVVLSVIALGLLLNAAASFAHLFRPAPATAQATLSDVNVTHIGGSPLDVYEWDDGTASPRIVVDRAVGGGEGAPLFVKITP